MVASNPQYIEADALDFLQSLLACEVEVRIDEAWVRACDQLPF